MVKKNIYKLILACSMGLSSPVSGELDYNCPESDEIKAIINDAIEQNKENVEVFTRFGVLRAKVHPDMGDLNNLSFDYASLLYNGGSSIPYEIACSYKTPNITFYTYSKNPGNPTRYIGLSPFWVPQNSSYATCTYSAKYCIFKEKSHD